MITTRKWQQLKTQMQNLGILETDIEEKFIIGSGQGGQKLHKTASCVYLKHIPSNIEIKCQETRFREDNRFHARRRLLEKIEEIELQEKSKKQQEIEKLRRQKKRRSRKAKLKILKDKAQRSQTKELRKSPSLKD